VNGKLQRWAVVLAGVTVTLAACGDNKPVASTSQVTDGTPGHPGCRGDTSRGHRRAAAAIRA
jgi:hypothetical protein